MIISRTHIYYLALFIATALTMAGSAIAADSLNGEEVLNSLDVSSRDIKKLEKGEVVTWSGEAYEQSARELASDATVLVDKNLDEVLAMINEQASLIPNDVTEGYRDINSRADFGGVGFDVNSDREFKEVETLYELKKGEDYNLTQQEFEKLTASLDATRNGNRAEKTAAASAAVRELLIGRYDAYQKSGLAGIAPYMNGKKQVNIGQELRVTTETLDIVEDHLPTYYDNLLNYPQGKDCCQQRFRWIKVKLLKRPAFGLTHASIYKTDNVLIVTERHFYVTHSLNSVQITVAWLPYGDGTYMGLAMSAQANALDSFVGRIARKLGRGKAEQMVGDVLINIKSELESGQKGSESMDFIK